MNDHPTSHPTSNPSITGLQSETGTHSAELTSWRTIANSLMPRWVIWVVLFGVLAAATLAWDYFFQPSSNRSSALSSPKPLTLNPSRTEHEAWIADAQGDLQNMRQELDAMKRKQEVLEQVVKQTQSKPDTSPLFPTPIASTSARQPVLKTATPAGLPPDPPFPMQTGNTPSASPNPSFPSNLPPPTRPTVAGASSTQHVPASPVSAAGEPSPDVKQPPPVGPPVQGPLVTPAPQPASSTTKPQSGQTPSKIRLLSVDQQAIRPKYWLQSGTIVPVRLLSGLDAPTGVGGAGAGGASDPHPVLMEIIDVAKLPNETTVDLVGCFVLGEGTGNLSTERAMIRTLAISCVKDGALAMDVPIKGVITGEDGKVGLRGRTVIRESAMLARTLLTGFVSGVSRAFMPLQMGFMVAQSPNQAFQFPDPMRVAGAGMAGGMMQAAQMLAQHYAQMAAKIYPVIEVDAGRLADLIIIEGRELKDTLK